MESEIGVGVVKLKVDFAKLDKDLNRVMPKVRSAVRGGIVIDTKIKTAGMARDMRAAIKQMPHNTVKMRLDLPAFGRDIRRAAGMVSAFRQSLGQHPLRLNLNTAQAHAQIRALRQALPPSLNTGVNVNARGGGGGGGFLSSPFGGSFAGNIAANVVGRAGGAAMNAGQSVIGAGVGVLSDGIQSNATLESYEKSLKLVIRDQAKANKLFRELKQLDIDLPVEIDLLAGEAMKLAGAGFEAGKIADMLVTIADAAAISPVGVNEGTSRAVRAITQMKAKGNIQMEDLNQLSEIGIPIRQIIQDQFGMSAGDLGQKTRSGEVSMDDAISGILKGLDSKFGGALEARATTFEGLLDQLTARYKEFAREISEPIFKDLIGGLKEVVEVLKSPEFKKFTSGVRRVATAGASIAGTVVGNTLGTGKGLAEITADAADLAGFTAGAVAHLYKTGSDKLGPNAAGVSGGVGGFLQTLVAGAVSGNLSDAVMVGMGGRTEADQKTAMDRAKQTEIDRIKNAKVQGQKSGLAAGFSALVGGKSGLVSSVGGMVAEGSLGTNLSAFGSKAAAGMGLDKLDPMGAFYEQAEKAKQLKAQNDLKSAKEVDRETRDTKARTQGDTDRADFKQRIADAIAANPGIADALRNTEFASTLQRDEKGNLRTQFEVTKLGEGPGAVQMTDFANLNSMIQGQVDQARMAKHAEDTAKATQELVKIANDTHLTQKEILKKQDEKLVPIFGP